MNKNKVYQKFLKLIRKWGGNIKQVSKEDYRKLCDDKNFFDAPFTSNLGIFWKDKIIVCSCDPKDKITEMIHEAGHIFADKKDPDHSDEFEFWGWEHAVAKKIGYVKCWKQNNADYQIELNKKVISFSYLNESEKRQVIKERKQIAEKNKLIIKGNPVSLR